MVEGPKQRGGTSSIPLAILSVVMTVLFTSSSYCIKSTNAFSSIPVSKHSTLHAFGIIHPTEMMRFHLSMTNDDDSSGDEEGFNLAAEFFQNFKKRGMEEVSIGSDDGDEEEDGDDESEDENARDISISELNRFTGLDQGKVGKLAGNVTFTNKELYSSLKERVLESPATFTNLVGGDNSEDDDEDTLDSTADSSPTTYTPPTSYPDSGLTAGEVITTVLAALNHNDIPEMNEGVKILFAYSSPASVLTNKEKAPTVEEYAEFLKTSEFKVLLDHTQVIVDKADYAYDRKKSYFTVRLKMGDAGRDFTSVNFILSTPGSGEDDCWLIDSMLIRPEGIRRRGRR